MQVLVKEDNVDFGISEVGVVCDGIDGVVFDGAMGVYVHHGVCDSFVGIASKSPSDILTTIPFHSFNDSMAFGN
jgi:hypothetical protein